MEAKFLGCVMVTHWLPHIPVQIFFDLFLVHRKVWCSLFSLNIQTRVLAVTFRITLLLCIVFILSNHRNSSDRRAPITNLKILKAGFSWYKKVLMREFSPTCLLQRRHSLNSKTRCSAQGVVSSYHQLQSTRHPPV